MKGRKGMCLYCERMTAKQNSLSNNKYWKYCNRYWDWCKFVARNCKGPFGRLSEKFKAEKSGSDN